MKGMQYASFYAAMEGRVVVGIEATGAMRWFLELLEELGIEYRVRHPAKIRAHISSAACRFTCAKNFCAGSWFNAGRVLAEHSVVLYRVVDRRRWPWPGASDGRS